MVINRTILLRSILGLIILSFIRRNEHDVVNVYDTFSNLMRIATGGKLLNFGYWTKDITNPLQAQIQLTKLFGIYGSFDTAQTILDVGSGFSIPALQWIHSYSDLKIYCLNISLKQLKSANSDIAQKSIIRRCQYSYKLELQILVIEYFTLIQLQHQCRLEMRVWTG